MDQNRFDALTRTLSGIPSRRHLLRGLLSLGPGLGAMRLADLVEAKKKHKKKRRKKRKPEMPAPNAFGCLDVGQACNGDSSTCCSGICEGTTPKLGKKDTSRCVAHDTGGCPPGVQDDACAASGTDIPCITSTGEPDGLCGTTTGKGGYCLYSGTCFPCRKDAECQAICGPRAACIRCDACTETGGTSCAHPDTGGCDVM